MLPIQLRYSYKTHFCEKKKDFTELPAIALLVKNVWMYKTTQRGKS